MNEQPLLPTAVHGIFFSDNAVEILGYFTLTFFIGVLVPDFRRRLTPSFVFYILTTWIASRLSVSSMFEFQLILFMTGIPIGVVRMSHYNGKVIVFVEALRMKELNSGGVSTFWELSLRRGFSPDKASYPSKRNLCFHLRRFLVGENFLELDKNHHAEVLAYF